MIELLSQCYKYILRGMAYLNQSIAVMKQQWAYGQCTKHGYKIECKRDDKHTWGKHRCIYCQKSFTRILTMDECHRSARVIELSRKMDENYAAKKAKAAMEESEPLHG